MVKQIISFLFLFVISLYAFAEPPIECATSKCIKLSWETPTQRLDGSAIQSLDGYRIYHTVSNVSQVPYNIGSEVTEHYIVNAVGGTHTFTIAAFEAGIEGEMSPPVSASILEAKIGPMILTIEVL